LDPAQKLAWVDSQIRRVAIGRAEAIGCPYCLSSIVIGVDRLCWTSMGEAVATILQRMEAESVGRRDDVKGFAAELSSTTGAGETKESSDGINSVHSIQ
jgi:hypothetical protein